MDYADQFYFTREETKFLVRRLTPNDKDLMQEGFHELSDLSKYLRFFAIRRKLTDYELNYFTDVDGYNHVAWGILDISGDKHIPVGVGRFVRLTKAANTAEIAIAVVDAYQRKGLGRILFAVLNILAEKQGIATLRYYVLSENQFVLNNLHRLGILKQEKDGQAMVVDTKVFSNNNDYSSTEGIQSFIDVISRTKKYMLNDQTGS